MENLGIDGKQIIAQIINFTLFYIVFARFIAKPLMRYIAKQKKDQEALETASYQAQEIKKNTTEESKKILADNLAEAQKKAHNTVQAAQTQAHDIVTKAKQQAITLSEQAQEEQKRLQEKLESQFAHKVKQEAQQIVQQKLANILDTKTQETLIKTL